MSIASKRRSTPLHLISSLLVLAWIIVAASPFLWTLWGSFKVQGDFFSKADRMNALWGTRYAFWLLMLALVFRAMPHITLVSGYLLPFFEWNVWGHIPTTIVVLVAINQPFTLWMLHSFFLNIPKDLDESAMVDGCTRFQAFRHVIVPVMWPGVITTGLFSFLLAYNDFTVTALLLNQENQTMIPKIASFLGSTQVEGNVMFAVAAVVSATAPLFVLILFFQRQIVSGLTAGAVKG
jgi:ABC-type glycerol-3-phosphate transport system permease component